MIGTFFFCRINLFCLIIWYVLYKNIPYIKPKVLFNEVEIKRPRHSKKYDIVFRNPWKSTFPNAMGVACNLTWKPLQMLLLINIIVEKKHMMFISALKKGILTKHPLVPSFLISQYYPEDVALIITPLNLLLLWSQNQTRHSATWTSSYQYALSHCWITETSIY